MTVATIKSQTQTFMAILNEVKPNRDGWRRLDRVQIAAQIGVSRVKIARIISKAERDFGIRVDGDRVKLLSRREFFLRGRKTDIPSLIAIAEEVARLLDQ